MQVRFLDRPLVDQFERNSIERALRKAERWKYQKSKPQPRIFVHAHKNLFAERFPPLRVCNPAANRLAERLGSGTLEKCAHSFKFRFQSGAKSRIARRLAIGVAEIRVQSSFGQG
jgi:hypothetical protein